MENKPDQNLFREVHRKVQDRRDKARKNHDDALQPNHKVTEDEKPLDFERPATISPPGD